jgi:hypothetical protein
VQEQAPCGPTTVLHTLDDYDESLYNPAAS